MTYRMTRNVSYLVFLLLLRCYKCQIPSIPLFQCGGKFERSEKISLVYSQEEESFYDIEIDNSGNNVYVIKRGEYIWGYYWDHPGYLFKTDLDFKTFKLISDTVFWDVCVSSGDDKIAGLSLYLDSLTNSKQIMILLMDTSGTIMKQINTNFKYGEKIEFLPSQDSILYFSAYESSLKLYKIYKLNINSSVIKEISDGKYFTFSPNDSLIVSDYGYITYHSGSQNLFYVDFVDVNDREGSEEIFVRNINSEQGICLYIRPYFISYIIRIEPHPSKNKIFFISTRLDWGPECLIEFDITEVWEYSF